MEVARMHDCVLGASPPNPCALIYFNKSLKEDIKVVFSWYIFWGKLCVFLFWFVKVCSDCSCAVG